MTQGATAAEDTAGLRNDSSAETLDQVVSTTSARLWVALVAALVLIAGALLWSFVAEIPVQTTAPGIVLQPGSRVVVPTPVDGSVALRRTVLEPVRQGDVVAVVTPFDTAVAPVDLVAPETGIISDILVQQGSGVAMGESIFITSAEAESAQVRVLSLVPATSIDTFKVGGQVTVTTEATASDPAQALDGTIVAVSDVPALLADVEALSGVVPVAESLIGTGNDPRYLVVVEADRTDTADVMRSGEIVTVVNTYDYVHPIDKIAKGTS